jgi:hypothetical protein
MKGSWYMFKTSLILLLAVFCPMCALAQAKSGSPKTFNHGTAAQEGGYFDASRREVIQPGALPADKVSATSIGDVLTLLFDSAQLSLQNDSDPLSATWVGTVRVPTRSGKAAPTSYLQHLRGSVNKTAGARVTLIVNLGGKTFTNEYPYGTTSHGDILRTYISPVRPRPAESYTATIIILVERRDTKSAVLVDVDSLDVEAKSAKKTKKK